MFISGTQVNDHKELRINKDNLQLYMADLRTPVYFCVQLINSMNDLSINLQLIKYVYLHVQLIVCRSDRLYQY